MFEVMSVLKMLKHPRILCAATYLNARINTTRNKTQINRIIQRRKEEKKIFGPLLENNKEKDQQKKTTINSISSSHTALNRKTNSNLGNNPELSWALNVSPERLCIIKPGLKSELIKIDQQSKSSCEVITTKNHFNTVPDSIYSPVNKKNELIDISSIKSAPLIHTAKSDLDGWESHTVLSLSPIDQKHFSLPGVTRILSESMSDKAKLLLENWKKRMILELGEAGFDAYQKDLLQNSKIMHSLIENTLKNEPVDVPDHLQLTYKSISSVLKDVKDVRFIESHVVHPTLGYRGFIDCIATYKGNLCVIDWKKSDKLKTLSTMYDSPLQISAYIGALNNDENYSFKVKTGLLAIAYAHGQPPSVFELSGAKLEFYWKEWLKRLEKYYAMRYS